MLITPYFLETSCGRIFCIERLPNTEVLSRIVLIIPPFGEEMNKSRHMFSLLAERLTGVGIGVACFDFHGTGDSEGDLRESGFSIWQKNIYDYARHLRDVYQVELDLLCVRTGALIACQSFEELTVVENLHFWNPVLNGKQFIGQFFRTRLATEMMKNAGAKLTMQNLIDELNAEKEIEIAGYCISKSLYDDFASAGLPAHEAELPVKRLFWYEINSQKKERLMPVSEKHLELFKGFGWPAKVALCQGDTFWSTQEISVATEAIDSMVHNYCEGGVIQPIANSSLQQNKTGRSG